MLSCFVALSGVIADDGRIGVPSRLDEVRSAWTELRFHKNIMDVSIATRDDLGMDALIEGEIKIDTSEYFIHVNIFLGKMTSW